MRQIYAWLLVALLSPHDITLLAQTATPFPLEKLSTTILDKKQQESAAGMLDRYIQRRTDEFNVQHREEWYKVKSRKDWELYRDARLQRLRESLGDEPNTIPLNTKITDVIQGDGFKIEKLLYQSRDGMWVPGNLYSPTQARDSMPGILIAHAHHRGKSDSELQDMGMTWARAGCVVLVIDQVGYGERRAHPFHRDEDYPHPYKKSRQDYYFRYDSGVQLQLLGDSLMGWMVHDLKRGVDVLLAQERIDSKRIILLGAVAGGGDPAGVTAALDPRIACCVPFNFGGPQPETRYPLPDDAETSFNYLLFTYWDSTRGLRLGARDDFPHWFITASTAPRYLIHGHEFSWDRERDPVWKRYQKIWEEFYDSENRLGAAHGKGILKLSPPEASHCNQIGAFHRRMIHPLFDQWFGIKVRSEDEYSAPRKSDELLCWSESAEQELKPLSLNAIMVEAAKERVKQARTRMANKTARERRDLLRAEWSQLLGPTKPANPAVVVSQSIDKLSDALQVERLVMEVEAGIMVPVLLLRPSSATKKVPVVIALAQEGKAGFVQQQTAELQKLLQAGMMVVLPDLRGTGETNAGKSRGRDSNATNQSVHLQLFGETLLGEQLRDLRSLLSMLRERGDVDSARISLWGDSFSPPNSADTRFQVPHGVEEWPKVAEPMGGLLALLGAMFEEDIHTVYVAGGLASYQDVLKHFAVLIPHAAAVPGALKAGDITDLAACLSPMPLRMEALVNHMNLPVSHEEMLHAYAPTIQAYSQSPDSLQLTIERSTPGSWLVEQLR